MTGCLAGIRVVELSAKGPAPFGVMLLADLGADVVRIDRPGGGAIDAMSRGRRSIAIDLKAEAGRALALRLVDGADVLVEGNRPGVAERLGIGPDVCRTRNPRLVYARTTGWGQDGPMAARAGHDLNFLAIAGALLPLGDGDRPPPPPLNLVGDFGGGGAFLVIGILAALLERTTSGLGQVVDAAMVDGVASMLTAYHGLRSAGQWTDERASNLVDGGAPSYRTYACADGGYVAVGCLEPGSYRAFLDGLGLDADAWPQHDRTGWPAQRAHLEAVFATAPRAHWERLFAGTDACVSPVLGLGEATRDPHLVHRSTFTEVDGVVTPAPAPRLSRTPGRIGRPAPRAGADTDEVLAELGLAPDERAQLRAAGTVA